MADTSSWKIEMSGISFTNVSSTNLYAVLYVDENRYNKSTIDLNFLNGSNLRLEFVVQESNIQQSQAQLVIKLRRKGTFITKRIGKIRIEIRELYQLRKVGKDSTTVSKQIVKRKCFGRKQQVGTAHITYRFENPSTDSPTCCTCTKCQPLPLQVAKLLLGTISSLVTCFVCGVPSGGSASAAVGCCICN
uniref:Uncharacterized protein n=1 Tax=Nelumbo nucifera TaxID=4432 RepID=A0A822ZD67_NELNU|nr:TPA_asm: hypothetical protein HUJ06_013841 [Nelumbo nucifera]